MQAGRFKLRTGVLGWGLITLLACGARAQPPSIPQASDQKFDQVIRDYLSFSVPVIGCEELDQIKDKVVLLDAREEIEYQTSHLPGARLIGFKDFNLESVADLSKDQPIVVYCSIGYRSEKIGEKLQEMGFKNVQNLYGSLFEWANQGRPLVNDKGATQQVHTYNKKWSKWVNVSTANKVSGK